MQLIEPVLPEAAKQYASRIAEIDVALERTRRNLGEAMLDGREADAVKLEKAVANAEAEQRRLRLGIEQSQVMAREAAAMQREAERSRRLGEARQLGEQFHSLAGEFDAITAQLISKADELTAISDRLGYEFDDLLDGGYWAAAMWAFQAAEGFLQRNPTLRFALLEIGGECREDWKPVQGRVPAFETVVRKTR